MTVARVATLVASLAAVGAATGCTAGGEGTGRASATIIGGTPTQGDPAVVMLVSYPADHQTFSTCTASLISPDVLLTAAHCIDASHHADEAWGVFAGADASAFTTANTLIPQLVDVSELHVHPDYEREPPFHADIGVALLAEPLDRPALPIQRAPLDASLVGTEARIVGYGETTYGELNLVRHEARTVVADVGTSDTLRVGDLDHRSCIGDSGGPALVVLDGVETIVGVDSYADVEGCLEPAHYRRTDAYREFIEQYVPAPPSQGGAGGAAGGAASGGSAHEANPASHPPAGDDGGCSVRAGSGSTRVALWLTILLLAAGRCRGARRQSGRRSRRPTGACASQVGGGPTARAT